MSALSVAQRSLYIGSFYCMVVGIEGKKTEKILLNEWGALPSVCTGLKDVKKKQLGNVFFYELHFVNIN